MKRRSILFVCPSLGWNVTERTVLQDCFAAIASGHRPILLCIQDSFLDLKAKDYGIERIYHRPKVSKNFLEWLHLRSLIESFDRLDVSLINCYDIDLLWPFCFYLRRKPLIPLVLTCRRRLEKRYRKVWHRVLSTRVDKVLLSSGEMVSNVMWHLKVAPRKLELTGQGIRLYAPSNAAKNAAPARAVYLGALVDPNIEEIDSITPLIYAMDVMKRNQGEDHPVHLVLISETPWKNRIIFKKLSEFIQSMNLSDRIDLYSDHSQPDSSVAAQQGYSIQTMRSMLGKLDVWISLEEGLAYDDAVLSALLERVPVLLPRCSLSKRLLGEERRWGETYRLGDSRELRTKLKSLIAALDTYRKNLGEDRALLEDRFGYAKYGKILIHTYERLWMKRERYYYRSRGKSPDIRAP